MLEKYYKYKSLYNDYLIFIKAGSFYECFSKDALIINKLFNYKIKKISNTFKCGFPVKNISSVTGKLADNNTNYIVEDNNIIIDKYETGDNKYSTYSFDMDSIMYNYIRVKKIIDYLENNIINSGINDKINKISELLEL